MIFQPSENPGSHERHLLRRNNNVLFGAKQTEIDDDTLMEAQKADHDILLEYHAEFKKVLNETINLDSNVESDIILGLKDRLDRLYEQSARVGDDQTEMQQSIKKLLSIIMSGIRTGAGNDAQAHQELDQEEAAREAHFKLLESPMVADMLDPDSVFGDDELVPVLLSASKDDLAMTLQIFDPQQLNLLLQHCELLTNIEKLGKEVPKEAAENAVFIEGFIEYMKTQTQ